MSSLSHVVPTCGGSDSSLWSHGSHMQVTKVKQYPPMRCCRARCEAGVKLRMSVLRETKPVPVHSSWTPSLCNEGP